MGAVAEVMRRDVNAMFSRRAPDVIGVVVNR